MRNNNLLNEYQELYQRIHGRRKTVAEQMHFGAELERNLNELKECFERMSHGEALELQRSLKSSSEPLGNQQ